MDKIALEEDIKNLCIFYIDLFDDYLAKGIITKEQHLEYTKIKKEFIDSII